VRVGREGWAGVWMRAGRLFGDDGGHLWESGEMSVWVAGSRLFVLGDWGEALSFG